MSPRRVMIVDDEKGIREALKQVLEYEEIEVQASASGHEAIRAYPDFKHGKVKRVIKDMRGPVRSTPASSHT